MHFTASTASALVVSLLAKDVLAAVHGRHQQFHHRRELVTDEVTETDTLTVYLTVDYPSGETLGAQTVGGPLMVTTAGDAVIPAFAAPVAQPTTSPAPAPVQSTTSPAPAPAESTTTPAPPPAQSTPVDTPVDTPSAAEFIQKPKPKPTTMVTVAKPSPVVPQSAAPVIPSSAPASGNKRGLLVADGDPSAAFVDSASWCWNWQSTAGHCPSSLEFVPIMWGEGYGREESWAGDAQAAIDKGATHLMAFNEPELAAQANIPDPATCASKYITYMQPFAGKAKLCSPSVTDDNEPGHGLDYMKAFLSACEGLGCTIDLLCIHVYKTFDAVDYFKQQLVEAYALTNNQTNIWVTEWGVTNGSEEQQAAYMQEALAFMESQPWVERQSYFYVDPKNPILADASGAPTALGAVYIA